MICTVREEQEELDRFLFLIDHKTEFQSREVTATAVNVVPTEFPKELYLLDTNFKNLVKKEVRSYFFILVLFNHLKSFLLLMIPSYLSCCVIFATKK